ncbi:unnamed protein product, partial [Cyprideis torosa]
MPYTMQTTPSFVHLKEYIRSIPNWPKEGIVFRDITTLLTDPLIFRQLIDAFVFRAMQQDIDAVVAIDARGFIIGAPVAHQLNCAFIPVRKKGKLPGPTVSRSYTLEYGEAEVEMHTDAIKKGAR